MALPTKRKHQVTETHRHPKYERLSIDLRTKSRFYQARASLNGRLQQKSLKVTSLKTAFKLAAEWYLKSLKAHQPAHPRVEKDATVAEVYASYKAQLRGSSKDYAEMKWRPIRDFWSSLNLNEIDSLTFREFYGWRRRQQVVNHTLHKDVVLIRQVLRYAEEHNVIEQFPAIPRIGKIAHNPRPWLTRDELNHLVTISKERMASAPNGRVRQQREDCHHFMLFMVHSGMRVGELRSLTFADCKTDTNENGDDILLCDVKGKSGHRQVVCRNVALNIVTTRFTDATEAGRSSSDLVFPHKTRDAFRELLVAAKLHTDATGQPRNLKSLRSTAITFQVLANVNPLLIARNSGTSLLMIDTFYVKRLTALMGKDALTTFSREKHPEMFVEFFIGNAMPPPRRDILPQIPMTKGRPQKGASLSKTNVPPAPVAKASEAIRRLDPETMREFLKARQSASSPTSKEISEFLAERATKNK